MGEVSLDIDYLARPEQDEVFLNEINTMPGSLAFYLWHEDGYSRANLVEKLVQLAIGRAGSQTPQYL